MCISVSLDNIGLILFSNFQEALKRRLNARIEYAKFLQDTVKEMAKEVQNSRSGEIKKTAEDLDEFMTKVSRLHPPFLQLRSLNFTSFVYHSWCTLLNGPCYIMLIKVRKGARVNNEEILGFAKLFNDELTLDNISRSIIYLLIKFCYPLACIFFNIYLVNLHLFDRPRLVNMCKYMGISPFGTDAYLRFMLRKRLQE